MNHRAMLAVTLMLAVSLAGCVPAPEMQPGPPAAPASTEPNDIVTPRMLTAPGALVGPGPSNFLWSPTGAALAYIEPQDGQDVLWLYDAATGEKRVLLDPAENPDEIDTRRRSGRPRVTGCCSRGRRSSGCSM